MFMDDHAEHKLNRELDSTDDAPDSEVCIIKLSCTNQMLCYCIYIIYARTYKQQEIEIIDEDLFSVSSYDYNDEYTYSSDEVNTRGFSYLILI